MLKWNLILCLPTNSMWLIFRAEKVYYVNTQYVFTGLNILHGLHEFSVVYNSTCTLLWMIMSMSMLLC